MAAGNVATATGLRKIPGQEPASKAVEHCCSYIDHVGSYFVLVPAECDTSCEALATRTHVQARGNQLQFWCGFAILLAEAADTL